MPYFEPPPNYHQSDLVRTKSDEAVSLRTGERYQLRRKRDDNPFGALLFALVIAALLL